MPKLNPASEKIAFLSIITYKIPEIARPEPISLNPSAIKTVCAFSGLINNCKINNLTMDINLVDFLLNFFINLLSKALF